MHSPDIQPAPFEARIEALHAQLLVLADRVHALEHRGAVQQQTWLGARQAAHSPTPIPVTPSVAATWQAPVAVTDEHDQAASNPGRVLAIIGGVALLLGLIGFVAYAIEQAWLPPLLRFIGAALISALLTVAAWPLARRGHSFVAGAIGGAGLGAWFASWLFARHAHELVSGPQLTIALVIGAAACLLIADRLRLRSMAQLAALAACATPMLVSIGGERLGELMWYQLAVVGVLSLVDARRRWPELPTLALGSTWLLGGRWASVHLGHDNGWMFMLWAAMIMLATVASAWRLLQSELEASERSHMLGRLFVAGLATWAAAAAAFMHAPATLAMLSVGLAAWQLFVAGVLERDAIARGSGPFVALAGAQLFAAGPLLVAGQALQGWWIGMSVLAAVVPWSAIARMRRTLMLIPAAAAVAWSVAHAHAPQAVLLPLLAASVPLASAMLGRWRSADGLDQRPDTGLSIAGVLLWTASVCAVGPAPIVARLAWCLVPLIGLIAHACVAPRRHAITLSQAAIVLAFIEVCAAIVDARALQAKGSPALAFALALITAALAGLVFALLQRAARARALEQLEGDDELVPLGSAIAVALGSAACLMVAALISDPAIEQIGFTVCVALTGLGSLIAGLRGQQPRWRELGLAAIAVAGCKVVLFDLAGASPVWRALAFMGIGAVLITGAMAYSRAQQRLSRA